VGVTIGDVVRGGGGVVTLWLIAIALTFLPFPARAQETARFDALDEILREAVTGGDVPGAVVLVGRGDRTLYQRAFGSRTLVPEPSPMATDTIFDIASLTKPLGTTIAVMSLVERGSVKLEAPVGRYIKEFKGRPFEGVTIRRLLTHSAGLPATPPGPVVPFPAYAKTLAKLKLDYPPGTGFEYSDTGFILLAEVVRRVSGARIDKYLERTVFVPLHMTDTSFHPGAAVLRRVAPTEFHDGHMLIGEVHDPRARGLGGVAGHAGMFSTASDLARLCRMLLNGGALGETRVLRPQTVRMMWARAPDGNGTRTLGWDMTSAYARPMMPFFPAGSVGHTGFTGTSVWIDPSSQGYVILLTNRVHPSGGNAARIRDLRTRVTAAAGAALFRPLLPQTAGTTPELPPTSTASGSSTAGQTAAEPPDLLPGPGVAPTPTGVSGKPDPVSVTVVPVRSGLDVLAAQDFAPLRGYRIGLVTNQTGIDARGRRGIDLIANAREVRLQAIFSPEHGITGQLDTNVANSRDVATGLPIWSLYGGVRRPTAEMLRGITLLVYDIQDVGARYYTYLTTLVYVMEEAARQQIPVVVLDRPNLITGRVVEGPLTDPDLESFTAPHEIPVRTGMTIGEFARMAAAERRIPVSLTVVPVTGWTRGRWYDETGLPWVSPSPNIRSVTQALLYSGIGLLEATNLSVGRGTDMPFEVVGAPWMDGDGLAAALNRRGLPGVRFTGVRFTPTADVYARLACGGIRMTVTDRDAIRPVTVALAVASELRERHRAEFKPESIQNLLVNRATMWAFLRGEPLPRLLAWADMDRSSFLNRRASYLIYP
jgi:uncharacterized protein YbbC (DUF1343 family)/CubicO group peptidase (beta-lactamase class C family)